MQRFFFDEEQIVDRKFSVYGEKYNHICKSLRMSVGERAVFCDGNFWDYECKLIALDSDSVQFEVIDSYKNKTEADLRITVYQCLAKGDKMDDMVKRCVQFGVYKIVPVLSNRCVSRPDTKSVSKKIQRLNKIARSSAMQSMRGYIPEVCDMINFEQAVSQMMKFSSAFICYEDEHVRVLDKSVVTGDDIAFLIGPEGGLDKSEIDFALNQGIPSLSLGRRILRTEDAAAFLIPMLLLLSNNL